MAEFSDRPMHPPPSEDQYYGFFRAKYVTQYLEAYIDDHVYNGKTLRDRIRFGTAVRYIERSSEKVAIHPWTICCYPESTGLNLHARKLIDATGISSQPKIPHLPGQEHFSGKIIHHKEFGKLGDLTQIKDQRFAVLGGAKSAADVAYSAAKAGKKVSWIIKEHGNGPAALLSPDVPGPYSNSNTFGNTRLFASLLPNTFGESFLSRFFHKTKVGRWLVKALWNAIDADQRKRANYQRQEGKHRGFGNLEPDTPVFWQNDSSGTNSRPDYYSVIANHVDVYRQDIDCLVDKAVMLAPSERNNAASRALPVDVLVLCTGWTTVSPMFSPAMASKLGLPTALVVGRTDIWKDLDHAHDNQILDEFPLLRDSPLYRREEPQQTPFRLYQTMVPIEDLNNHSLVFLGKLVIGNHFRSAEIQALWAVAYLDGHINVSETNVRLSISRTVAWCRRRYLNKGELGNWVFFDAVDYTDMLLAELGLKCHRRKGRLGNFFAPCKASDLTGSTEEYKALYSSSRLPKG